MGNQKLSTTRLTAAGAITPPNKGDTLVRMVLEPGATPGSLSIVFDGQRTAHFPVQGLATGIAQAARYYVGQKLQAAIAAGVVAFNGGLAAVTFVWANTSEQGGGPVPRMKEDEYDARDFSAWAAVRASRTTTGSSTLALPIQTTLDCVVILQSASAGRVTLTTLGGYTDVAYADTSPAPDFEGSACREVSNAMGQGTSFIVTQTLDGAATQDVYAFYNR
jgi:hypothetical protein